MYAASAADRWHPVEHDLAVRLGVFDHRPAFDSSRVSARALLLRILYTVRSERTLIEQFDYHLVFRWLVGLQMDDAVWDRTVFSANRDRLLSTDTAREFFQRLLCLTEWQGLVSAEHFSVDGSMIEAWAGHKSLVRKHGDGSNPPKAQSKRGFQERQAQQKAHESKTDPQSRLYKKGEYSEASLRFLTHALAENRNGLIVAVEATQSMAAPNGSRPNA